MYGFEYHIKVSITMQIDLLCELEAGVLTTQRLSYSKELNQIVL